MKRYQKKSYIVKAEQWDGKDHPKVNIIRDSKGNILTAYVRLSAGSMEINPGDYLVIYETGFTIVYPKSTFEFSFEELAERSYR